MTDTNKTIKELKQILSEHNCAIPNGAKKQDLIKLTETIMSNDEDFVDAQSSSVATFDDMFDEPVRDATKEEKEQESNEEESPSIFSDGWNDYAMSHFKSNELIDGNPVCAGLRRVAELLLGEIIDSGPVQVFPATDNNGPGRATVVFKVTFNWMNSGQTKSFSEVADVWHGNTDDLFCAHPAATASTRAEGRALRKALKLRCLAAEELAKKNIVDIVKQAVASAPTSGEYEHNKNISSQQVQFIDARCNQLDIDVTKFINMGENTYVNINDITRESAKKMIKVLNTYQNGSEIPNKVKDYNMNWRE
jgi:hypothetical protein|tara:strand:+ start:2626 stop:3546 length:921 start_codon:yes stop_codon:yes gene_type:complete